MNLILLGGNGVENKMWIEKIETTLKPLFSTTYIQYYMHWQKGGEMVDINLEANKLSSYAKDIREYVIFAKSAGILITAKAVHDNALRPVKCIFTGIPISWAISKGFDISNWFEGFKDTSLVIQHNEDPFASSKNVSEFITKENMINTNLVELPGNTHDYLEYDRIKKIVADFVY
ncbi:hypothetical protein HYV64_00690 [Candidatus Shapirobacteria bacterium]|nr:hypothetical protein [Candidatus Shapirobacteria bacterium]